MKTKEEVIAATCCVKVWTRISEDQQVYKFYDRNKLLIGFNFVYGVEAVEHPEPDVKLFSIYTNLAMHKILYQEQASQDELISETIRMWNAYMLDTYPSTQEDQERFNIINRM